MKLEFPRQILEKPSTIKYHSIRPAADEFFHVEQSPFAILRTRPKNSIFSKPRQQAGHGPTTGPKRRRRRNKSLDLQ
jgi:hypothetical protein